MKTRKLMKSINTKADAMKKWTKADWHLFYGMLARYDKQTKIHKRYAALLHEIECIKIGMMHATNPQERERCWHEIDSVRQRQIELFRLRRVDDEPDTARGAKVLKSASQAGQGRASYYKGPIRDALADVDKYMADHPNVSKTEARKRIAPKHGLNAKTLERHAKKTCRK